ncbi:M24 family metallopeptidase [Halomarina rubra]|uniref:M24 family metallopeptidase n=1 Tax=Halomarina rubra TaxID=2071873 RepID=A0ABD6AS54_9EURY|nr:M24 family metallopeptidase [Halomarina rubra]
MPDPDLIREKVAQAQRACEATDTDLWLTFCRETGDSPDPSLPLVLGFDVVWATMVAVPREGESTVVLGRHDAPTARDLGVHEVVGYDESIEGAFHDLLERVDPDTIAVNYDEADPVADGLTHGLFRKLESLLDGTGYEDTLVSASDIVRRVRGRKSPAEREWMTRAAETSEAFLADAIAHWTPETTEREFAAFVHDRMREEGLDSAWAWEYCPTVHMGGASEVGHTTAGDLTLPPGEVLHVDFGVKVEGYAADIQRLYYRPSDAYPEPPADLVDAHADVRAAIDAAFDALEPGALGHAVDAAARAELTDRGWPEYAHATGHGVGRFAHDGGTLLGPRWDRYGDAPDGAVRAGEVYTLELGVETEWGYLGQEDLALVTEDGAEWFHPPQTALRVLD